jgi:hypothetical protein
MAGEQGDLEQVRVLGMDCKIPDLHVLCHAGAK